MIASVELGYLMGHLRYGHIECTIPEDFKEEFLKMSKEEQKEYVIDGGRVVVDDFEIDDLGDYGDVEIYTN